MSNNSWRNIYTAMFFLSLPVIYLRLLWRSLKLPAYRYRWKERLAILNCPNAYRGAICIHGASVGEAIIAISLVKALQKQYPKIPIVVTTVTPTGSQQIQTKLGKSVFHSYAPYDLPGCIRRFINTIKPRLFIFIETELWPNWLYLAHKRNIPCLLANGRLSPKSYWYYRRFPLAKTMMHCLDSAAIQSEEDAKRLTHLGLPKDRVAVIGNIKFDMMIPADLAANAKLLRQQLGEKRPIWLAASTHCGEEQQVLEAFAKIRKTIPECLLIIVPRHPNRFDEVKKHCQQQHYRVALRSHQQSCNDNTDIFIGDTMGELLLFYAVSTVAFVGGSLVATGGHNTLEPAALALPVITGNSTFNFAKITKLLCDANALIIVDDAQSLAQAVCDFLQDSNKCYRYGQNAYSVVCSNRGALQRHLELIAPFLEK